MFKRRSVTPIFVVFLIVACFDGLSFARAANVVLDDTNKQGNVVTQQKGDIEFTLVLGSKKFYRDQTKPKTLELDVGGCQVSIERKSDDEVKVVSGSNDHSFEGNIFGFTINDNKELKIYDENMDDPAQDIKVCDVTSIDATTNAPEKSVLIKLDKDFAPGLFLYASDIRLAGASTTDASSPSSSEGLSAPVWIAIGAAAGLVGALVIVGIVSLICCLVKKKGSDEKAVVKDVSVRNEKTKEATVGAGGEKSAFKDVTDNKSAYNASVAASPVTPSLL